MKKVVLMSVFVLLAAQSVFAQQELIDIFVEGNEAYREGRYSEAITSYEKKLTSRKSSGALYYNLANAYFKQGRIGKAVLNYERAFEFIPRDSDLQANYRYTLSVVKEMEEQGIEDFFKIFLRGCFHLFTVNELVWIIVMLIMVLAGSHLCSLYFLWRLSRRNALMGFLILIIVFFVFGLKDRFNISEGRAVVLEDTTAKFEPREDATTHFSLFEGNYAAIIKQESGWYKVKRFDGKIGWVVSAALEAVQLSSTKG